MWSVHTSQLTLHSNTRKNGKQEITINRALYHNQCLDEPVTYIYLSRAIADMSSFLIVSGIYVYVEGKCSYILII